MEDKKAPKPKKPYVVYIKGNRSEPSFAPQHVFAYSASDAVRTAREQGFIVRHARRVEEYGC